MIGTIEEYRYFVCSSSRDFKSFNRSAEKYLVGRKRRSHINVTYRLYAAINYPIMTVRNRLASGYQSTSSDPSSNCALSVLTCITSRGHLKGTVRIFELNISPWFTLMKQPVLNLNYNSICVVFQQWQYQQLLLNCIFLQKHCKKFMKTLNHCVSSNQETKSLHLEQTVDFEFHFA